ncbi:hypothetical protein O181_001391 [Austropuccinia psidii MF-1]|uniref:Integrase catalytic domain-containing protein n=1 Tax=Austropuccinia psidii MF-1 TaxID=1389203 RepID=A0A9Q3BAW8_9BASI|nr:hypothetical protein [Austropuccinia psidii MF-1]
MNPLCFPTTSKLSFRKWHLRLRHASDKVVRSFLKQHVPSFELKSWQPFYCKVCAKSKSTHQLAKVCVDVPIDKPFDLLVSDIMGPFSQDPQVFQYLLTIRDHVLMYSIVYPLKLRLDVPAAILDAIAHLSVQLGISPKRLRTDNSREFVSASLTTALSKLGVGFHPLLPYSPQENGEAERLNRTQGDMLRVTVPRFIATPGLVQTATVDHDIIPVWGKGYSSGGWLLWDVVGNQMIYSASAIFPFFQTALSDKGTLAKGSLRHMLNTMSLGQVPTELYFECEEKVINSLLLAKDISVLENLRQALGGPHQHHWEQACLDKLNQMKRRGVWQAINRTPAMRTIGHCWVFNTKLDEYGNIEKFKVQLLLVTACLQRWKVCSFDVSGAYLYSLIEETVLMEPPTHFIPSLKGKVLHLQKALYGMKQVGRCWWLHLSGILESLGFALCEVDLSLYMFQKDKAIIVIWIHVDDGVIASNSPTQIEEFRKALCNNFEIKWSDNMKWIVGLEWAFGEGEVTISHTRLTNDIIDAYPRKIFQHECPLLPIPKKTLDEQEAIMEATPFRSGIGSLAYLVSGSRPDLAFAVNYPTRHSTAPTRTHWTMLDHLMGYLLKTRGHAIVLCLRDCSINLWGGELEQSQSGFMLKLGDAPILWDSKRQTMVALSTCAAEYIALSDSTQHLVQAINQLTQMEQDFKKTILCDNQSAVQVLIHNLSRKRMQYLNRAFFFVNNVICKHKVVVKWATTQEIQADALTKQLSGQSLTQALQFLNVMGNSADVVFEEVFHPVSIPNYHLWSQNHNSDYDDTEPQSSLQSENFISEEVYRAFPPLTVLKTDKSGPFLTGKGPHHHELAFLCSKTVLYQ